LMAPHRSHTAQLRLEPQLARIHDITRSRDADTTVEHTDMETYRKGKHKCASISDLVRCKSGGGQVRGCTPATNIYTTVALSDCSKQRPHSTASTINLYIEAPAASISGQSFSNTSSTKWPILRSAGTSIERPNNFDCNSHDVAGCMICSASG
jgi:hypothetical protein